MNPAKPNNNFEWSRPNPFKWLIPTSQNSTLPLKPTMNSISYNINPNNVSTWKPTVHSPNNTLNGFNNQKVKLDPIEPMDCSDYDPSYYERNNISFKPF